MRLAALPGLDDLLGAEVHLSPAQANAFLQPHAGCPHERKERRIIAAHTSIQRIGFSVLKLADALHRLRQQQLAPFRLVLERRALGPREGEQALQYLGGRSVHGRVGNPGRILLALQALAAPPCYHFFRLGVVDLGQRCCLAEVIDQPAQVGHGRVRVGVIPRLIGPQPCGDIVHRQRGA